MACWIVDDGQVPWPGCFGVGTPVGAGGSLDAAPYVVVRSPREVYRVSRVPDGKASTAVGEAALHLEALHVVQCLALGFAGRPGTDGSTRVVRCLFQHHPVVGVPKVRDVVVAAAALVGDVARGRRQEYNPPRCLRGGEYADGQF